MATPPIKEIFSNATMTIDLTTFEDEEKVIDLIRKMPFKRLNSTSYEVQGSFQKLEEVFYNLSLLKRSDPTGAQVQVQDDRNYHMSAQVKPVEVSEEIMRYIEQKCFKDLLRIAGREVGIEPRRNQGKILVYFQPLNQRSDKNCCLSVRDKFVAFYQNIEAQFRVRTYDIASTDQHHLMRLESLFPNLVITESQHLHKWKKYVTVAGSAEDVVGFEALMSRGWDVSAEAVSEQRPPTELVYVERSNSAARMEQQEKVKKEEQEKSCPICLDTMETGNMKTLPQCQHSFCKGCLRRAFDSKPVCPVCGVVYGELRGTQPLHGAMEVSTTTASLPGNSNYGSIVIRYFIPSGIQGDDHPNPGQRYEGVSRVAFLPDSSEGRKVLGLLRRAFDQRLIFTVGRSATTGRNDVVTWNDIHHKTSREGGPTNYGYPDPDYLSRVQEELKAKGIC